jgi:hypothetical protein
MPKSRRTYAEELVEEAKKGLFAGLPIYGDFNPCNDTRDMVAEMMAEIVDAWNYNDFYLQMFPDKVEFCGKMRSLLLATYIALREEEENRTLKRGGAA